MHKNSEIPRASTTRRNEKSLEGAIIAYSGFSLSWTTGGGGR